MRNVPEHHISPDVRPEGRVLITQHNAELCVDKQRGIAEPQPAACLRSIFKRDNIFYRSGPIKTQFVQTVLLENITAMTKDKAPKYKIDLTVEETQGAW